MSTTESGNARAILAILVGMACFTVVDVLMKLSSESLPVGETIVIRNVVSTLLILGYGVAAGGLVLPAKPPWRLLSWRMLGEGGSTIAFLTALAAMPLPDAAGIGQFGPLAIMAAAALFLGEPVGWRRWAATFAGFVGVMLIIRPGTGAFAPAGLLVLASIALNIVRDFATRGISATVPTIALTAMSSLATLAAGIAMLPFEVWVTPSAWDVARLAVAGLFLIGGYAAMIVTMRNGLVSAATPFRYSGMVLALAAGWLIWGHVPDPVGLTGIAIVCAAGLYSIERERVRKEEQQRVGTV